MRSVIVTHPRFEMDWPFSADHLHALWSAQGPVEFVRITDDDSRMLGQIVDSPETVTRMVTLAVPVTVDCLKRFTGLREVTLVPNPDPDFMNYLQSTGVNVYQHKSEGYWGQSVAEFALALTLCGLRRIPQLHRNIVTGVALWDYSPPNNLGRPGARGHQFGDDPKFANGTVAGKRVRIVGAGNIASRYASFVHMLGADVAAWDPFAQEPCFHRSGARKEWHLEQLVKDAEVFVPMVPLTDSTEGLVTAELIRALPKGSLVVLVTRAGICDMPTLRKRVTADELSLAADVFDVEPLPLDDPLLGRHNVVHTPHNAGRTIDANKRWAEELAAQFRPI